MQEIIAEIVLRTVKIVQETALRKQLQEIVLKTVQEIQLEINSNKERDGLN